jgi:hypothetical protein
MKRFVPNQQFQAAPTVAPHFLISDANQNYQHATVASITDPITDAIAKVAADALTAVQDVLYSDRILTAAEIAANSYTFRLVPRVPMTQPVEVTVADANGQSGIVVAHSIAGFGPTTSEGAYGAFDVTVTGFAEELAEDGSLGILTTWKKIMPVVPN